MRSPYCLILSGSSGTGKSSAARQLWETLPGNPAYLSLDSIKHFVQGAKSNNHFLDLARESALSLTENYLESGHPVILEKAFGKYEYVFPFVKLAKRKLVESYYFKLTAPLDILIERVESRKEISLEKKIQKGEWPLPVGNKHTAQKIYQYFQENEHNEGIEIDTTDNSTEQVVSIIRSYLDQ